MMLSKAPKLWQRRAVYMSGFTSGISAAAS